MLQSVFLYCVLLILPQTAWKYNTIDIKLETSTSSDKCDNSNVFMAQLIGVPCKKDIVITGFESKIPNEKIHIELNNDLTPIWLKPDDNWYKFKWINNQDHNHFIFTNLKGEQQQILTMEQLMEMVLQKRVAIVDRSDMKEGKPSRWMKPMPLTDIMLVDQQREELKVETNLKEYGSPQKIIITNFDLKDAGYVLGTQRHWFKMTEIQITAKLVLQATSKNALYFLERTAVKPYYIWRPYFFVKRDASYDYKKHDASFKYEFVEIVPIYSKHEGKKKMLSVINILDLSKRGMIAFDSVGKYLLIGKRNKKYDVKKSGKIIYSPLDVFAAKMDDDLEDEYYDEYYYEDVSRLLRFSKYSSNAYLS